MTALFLVLLILLVLLNGLFVAAEFALVAVPATLLMYGVMEVSWQLVTMGALDQATLQAARFGVMGTT